MFYGKDDNPIRGMPPPLVYLSGYGAYGYDNHPMVVTNFTLSYPNDVDYIRAQPGGITNQQLAAYKTPSYNTSTPGVTRMAISNLINKIFKFGNGNVLTSASKSFTSSSSMGDSGSSYTMIPTKMQISISCQPMATRRAISNKFSLHDYATGSLLQGSKNKTNGGGIW
jgi:hypothetical protein